MNRMIDEEQYVAQTPVAPTNDDRSIGDAVEDDRSIGDAVEEVIDRGQRLIADSIELVRFDLERMLHAKALGWAVALVGAITLGLSWIALMVVAALLLAPILTGAVAVAILAGLHVIGGVVLIWKGRSMAKMTDGESISQTISELERKNEP